MGCKHKIMKVGSCVAAVFALALSIMLAVPCSEVSASINTITLFNGDMEEYGTHRTRVRWATAVNGNTIDQGSAAGTSKSYAYCVQPELDTPEAGTYAVEPISNDSSGRLSDMRKMIYYLPGGYGYKAITKSRWFSSLPPGNTDFTTAHVILSYMYDYCSGSSDAWIGTSEALRNKIIGIVADLRNLPDPPANFEVFWIKGNECQDTFGAIYATEYGKAAVKKVSSNNVITDGNSCYTLEGAKYTVYTNSACTNVAKTKSGADAVITVKADGTSDPIEIESGDYFIKETTAPRGYALDKEIHSLQIVRDKTTTYSAKDTPKSNPISLIIEKIDRETGKSVPQGAATLEGAEYTVKYYDCEAYSDMSEQELIEAVNGREPATINGRPATWVFRTDKSCKIDFQKNENVLVKERSSDFYHDSLGRNVLPIGIVTIQETHAPEGYVLDNKVYARAITEDGNVETLNTFNALSGRNAVSDQVYRGDVSFSKSHEGVERMHFVPFKITSLTTGESHILVTDENGYASTRAKWNLHTYGTNAGKSSFDGIWFNGRNDAGEGAKPDNLLGALPYDTYSLEELPCESNKNYKLFKDTITINRHDVEIDLGTFDNKIKPEEVTEKKIEKPATSDNGNLLIAYSMLGILAAAEAVLLTIYRKGDRLTGRK